jgi:hypothetical protein
MCAMTIRILAAGLLLTLPHDAMAQTPTPGERTYTVHIQANVPAKQYWSMIVYASRAHS